VAYFGAMDFMRYSGSKAQVGNI